MRRTTISIALALLVLALVGLSGCSAVDGVAAPLHTSKPIRVTGSRTCIPLLEILEEGSGEAGDFAYLPSVYSSGGISGVAAGDADIGTVSRYLTEEELKLGLRYELLSWDALAFAVHPSVTLNGLTTQQIRDIYSGTITNWRDLGGPDISITVFDRADGGTPKLIVRRYVLGEDLEVTAGAIVVDQETDMVDGIRGTKGGIGFMSFGWATARKVPVHVLKLDGIAPGVGNTLNGAYPLARPLGLVARKDADPRVQRFLEWATGDDAAALMARRGYAPAQ